MLSKAQKWASIFIGTPLLGNMDGRFFLGAFLLEEFLLDPLEICKCPVDEYLCPYVSPAREPGGGSFAGTFERKEVVYLGPFFGPRGH